MSLTLRSAFVLVLATALFPGSRPPASADDDRLVALLPRSRHTIAQAVRQAEYPCPHEPVISARFERNHDGKLSLSLASAEKGLSVAAEHNVLKELVASPESERWTPAVEVFKEVEHVARAATELTLAALSKFTLLEVLERAEKDEPGIVYAITPVVVERRALWVVRVSTKAGVVSLRYDLLSGERIKNP